MQRRSSCDNVWALVPAPSGQLGAAKCLSVMILVESSAVYGDS
jgi:hypothetical protein